MTDKSTWKKRERSAARFFGAERNSLSGGNSKLSRSDSTHKELYIECKLRVKHSVVALWDDTKTKADKEGKVPVICLMEKGRPDFWIMVKSTDLVDVANAIKENVPWIEQKEKQEVREDPILPPMGRVNDPRFSGEKPIKVYCHLCDMDFDEKTVEVVDVEENDLHQDVILFECPNCKGQSKSLRLLY